MKGSEFMFIVDKVLLRNSLAGVQEKEDNRHNLLTFECVEDYGFAKDENLCEELDKVPHGIENIDKASEICAKCWCRDV